MGGNQPGERVRRRYFRPGPRGEQRDRRRAHARSGARPRAGATATGAGEQRRERAARGCAPRVARGIGATEGGVGGGFSRFGVQLAAAAAAAAAIGGGWAGRAGSGRSSPGLSASGGSVGRNLDDAEAFPTLGGANPNRGLKKQPRHMQPRGGNPAGSAKVPAPVPARAAEVLAARLRGLANAGARRRVGGGSFVGGSEPSSLASDEEHFHEPRRVVVKHRGSARPNAQRFAAPPGFNADGEATAPSAAGRQGRLHRGRGLRTRRE